MFCRIAKLGVVIGVLFLATVCVAVVAEAAVWNSKTYEDQFSGSVAGSPLTTYVPLLAPVGSSYFRTTADGNWQIESAGFHAVDVDSTNTDHRIVIDTGVSDGDFIAVTEWNSGLSGIVFRSDGEVSPNETMYFAWYHDSSNTINLAQLVNGVFSGFGTRSCDVFVPGNPIVWIVNMNGSNIQLTANCPSGPATYSILTSSPALNTGTHVGFFSKDGLGDNEVTEASMFTNLEQESPNVIIESGTIQDTGTIAFLWAGLAMLCAVIGFRNQAGIFHIVAGVFVFLFMLQMDMMLVYLAGSGLMIFLVYSSGVLKR